MKPVVHWIALQHRAGAAIDKEVDIFSVMNKVFLNRSIHITLDGWFQVLFGFEYYN